MLKNGLGKLLLSESEHFDRFVDLFTGAGFVACYVAENTKVPVMAVDLQAYSTVLAQAILGRTKQSNSIDIIKKWIGTAISLRNKDPLWEKVEAHARAVRKTKKWVLDARKLCGTESKIGPIWNAYGGHYFSPAQALTFDYLLADLPKEKNRRNLCLAACISAASECVASPGHTAQPFQPTKSAISFILDAWQRDAIVYCKKNLIDLASRHAQITGKVITGDALNAVDKLNSKDLVFIDPPYSSVQYSRFYHVLETMARGYQKISVEGVGRYIPIKDRPQSQFSNTSQAKAALKSLIRKLAAKECTVIFTFPSGEASNGLSGDYIRQIAGEFYKVEDYTTINGKFSTLGGNNEGRDARKTSSELILLMMPKSE
ncbi:MAG: adenine-specific DNA methylase-like protein [Anaerolineaceae bacterium]|nr:MAG: adenine-specific DNA methylase-like protein [Anaerolineaceae bacterium]